MELLEQYLKTVRANLPKSQQDDIIRELSENIRAQMEDREASLGRPLTQAEQEAILKAHGHPMAVASRFRGEQRSFTFGRQWIGPELFPIYSKILMINAVVTATVLWFLLSMVLAAPALPTETITFIQPRSRFALAGPRGIEIPVQTRTGRHPDNRAFRLSWDGEGCGGVWAKSMDGDDEAGVQPEQPINVLVSAGTCTFTAALYGSGQKIRALGKFEMHVCGGVDECDHQ